MIAPQILARMTGVEKRMIIFAKTEDRLEYLRQTCFTYDKLSVSDMAELKKTLDDGYITEATAWKD